MAALTVFIPDVHGDPEALKKTLVAAKLAEIRQGKFAFNNPGLREIVFTGDYIDRGVASLKTLELLQAVTEAFERVVIQPGNHELGALQALTHPMQPRWMREWLDGVTVLQEVSQRFHLKPLSRPTRDAHPLADTLLPKEDPETEKYLAAWERLVESQPELQTTDFPAAYGRTRELFLTGPFRALFEQMRVAHRVGGILAVHAGMNEAGCRLGLERLQQMYALAWERQEWEFLYDFYGDGRPRPLAHLFCMTKSLPPDDTPLITEKTADMLFRDGVRVLIHGHAAIGPRLPRPGVQECNNAYGKVAEMNGDVVMSRWHREHTGSEWGFIQYDEETGRITAMNPKTGALDFGTLVGGRYTFPRNSA